MSTTTESVHAEAISTQIDPVIAAAIAQYENNQEARVRFVISLFTRLIFQVFRHVGSVEAFLTVFDWLHKVVSAEIRQQQRDRAH